jgi:hypothetical protein
LLKGVVVEGIHGAGKGDSYRPINKTKFDKNYDAIFAKDCKPKQKRSDKPLTSWIVLIEESLFLDLDPETGQETSEKKCYIRIPPEVCRKMKIRVGTPLDIRVRDGKILVTKKKRKEKKS